MTLKTVIFLSALLVLISCVLANNKWRRPGCHLVGHKREIRIQGCSQFTLESNACRGFCESYAVPAPPPFVTKNKHIQNITSVGECCNMMEEEDITAVVRCLTDDGVAENRTVTLKSAKSCGCYLCKDELPA